MIGQRSEGCLTRRQVMAGTVAAVGASFLSGKTGAAGPATQMGRGMFGFKGEPIKAFCVDFNWGEKGPSEPGLYAQADPEEHASWFRDLEYGMENTNQE